jgi:phytol kinase
MLVGGFLFAVLVLWAFVSQRYFPSPMARYIIPIGMIALGMTLIESLPFTDVDNITIPLVSVLIGLFVF